MDERAGPIYRRAREVVEQCLRRELAPGAALPPDDEDLVETGALDSMGWVGVLRCIETATGIHNLTDLIGEDAPRSIRSLESALEQDPSRRAAAKRAQPASSVGSALSGAITGWGISLGCARVEATAVEREYGLAAGTLSERAGLESVARAGAEEDELSLALVACQAALRRVQADASEVDWIVATSETFLGYPSLGSLLHARLLARDACGVLDVGGACVGLLNCLCAGRALLAAGMASRVLVITADVHSRQLAPGRVPGDFGGLFGDGSSAFVLGRAEESAGAPAYRLGEFQFGCAGTFSSLLALRVSPNGGLTVQFEAEALARAAVARLEAILADLELRTGLSRDAASSFATHQPNPRLVALLARQAGLPLEKFPGVAKTYGNLGSSTCGVALAKALDAHASKPADQRGPIFLAAVGPGMLWGGGVLC